MATDRKPISEKRKKYIKAWNDEHYKLINIAFRKEDDSDILESLEEARRTGISNREWLRMLFEAYKEN